MGKSHKARAAQEAQRATRRRQIIGGTAAVVIGAGALFGATQVVQGGETSETEQAFAAAKAKFSDRYDCRYIGKITLKSGKLKDVSIKSEITGTRYGVTFGNDITMEKSISAEAAGNSALHELIHACANAKPKKFSRSFDINAEDEVLKVTGSQAFNLWFSDSTIEEPNTFSYIEEGVTEWLASGIDNYIPTSHETYIAFTTLTDMLTQRAELSRDEVFYMHENSDLLGFIGAIYHKDRDSLTGPDLNTIVHLYGRTKDYGTPPQDVLNEILTSNSTY